MSNSAMMNVVADIEATIRQANVPADLVDTGVPLLRGEGPTFVPAEKMLLVRRAAPETKTPMGILLPDSAQDKRTGWGEVAAAGPGVPYANRTRVYFQPYAGYKVELPGASARDEYILMKLEDILGVIEDR